MASSRPVTPDSLEKVLIRPKPVYPVPGRFFDQLVIGAGSDQPFVDSVCWRAKNAEEIRSPLHVRNPLSRSVVVRFFGGQTVEIRGKSAPEVCDLNIGDDLTRIPQVSYVKESSKKKEEIYPFYFRAISNHSFVCKVDLWKFTRLELPGKRIFFFLTGTYEEEKGTALKSDLLCFQVLNLFENTKIEVLFKDGTTHTAYHCFKKNPQEIEQISLTLISYGTTYILKNSL